MEALKGQKVIAYKCVFKKKWGTLNFDGVRYKTWLVEKNYSQVESIDYHDIFSLVVKHNSICVLLFIVTSYNLVLE